MMNQSSTDSEFSTPMMLQYMELKQQYQDCLLFFRLGDFYELFLDDALIGSKILDITLTSRSRGKDGRIPMAGVPYHAVDSYLGKLIKAGYKVAICEQMTPPDKKGLVEREVVRIITPGTVSDLHLLSDKNNNFLLAVILDKKQLGVAAADISTGELRLNSFPVDSTQGLIEILNQIITHLQPSECIVSPELTAADDVAVALRAYPNLKVFPFNDWVKTAAAAQKAITDCDTPQANLQASELLKQPATSLATANLLRYLQYTQKTDLHHLQPVTALLGNQYLQMDRSTIANLELLTTLHQQETTGSLLSIMDYTQTAMGGRLLKQWLLRPLVNIEQIEQRLDAVTFLVEQTTIRETISQELKQIHDIERLLARLSLGTGNPRDLQNLNHSLLRLLTLADFLATTSAPTSLKVDLEQLQTELREVVSRISSILVDNPPLDPKAGGLIRTGVNSQLDTLQETTVHNREWLVQFELRERAQTGIGSLKVKYNQVFGFYIEISKANLHLAPSAYFRKQTLVNAERFTTQELQDREKILLAAESHMQELEYTLFTQLVTEVLMHISALQKAAQAVARIDCLTSFSQLAVDHQYVRPLLHTGSELEIRAGRHPVVEQLLGHQAFVPNDVCLDQQTQQLLVLTGPNMAGKSVLMRQVALITLMAHLGSFVPAQAARISVTDHIFVRSGAADMITAGLSTFMVEMVETATILRRATAKSLVIMDEIGRGTSTHDGISIAWSVAEYLVHHLKPGPKTLFATHYHELQALAETFPNQIKNFHMAITNHEGRLVFLYTLTPGGTSQSFGLAVAELAGIPNPVIQRAHELLRDIQRDTEHLGKSSPTDVTKSANTIFHNKSDLQQQAWSKIVKNVENININQLTPVQSLQTLDQLLESLKPLIGEVN